MSAGIYICNYQDKSRCGMIDLNNIGCVKFCKTVDDADYTYYAINEFFRNILPRLDLTVDSFTQICNELSKRIREKESIQHIIKFKSNPDLEIIFMDSNCNSSVPMITIEHKKYKPIYGMSLQDLLDMLPELNISEKDKLKIQNEIFKRI